MRRKRMTLALMGVLWGWICVVSPSLAQTSERERREEAEAAYERALRMVREEEYREAADMMRALREQYRETEHVANALYWEAFALYRLGGTDELREATDRLRELFEQYEEEAREGDGLGLATRIERALAERGDRRAAERLERMAQRLRERGHSDEEWDDDDVRLMALDAVMQMDSDKALPILRSVLARRDSGSEKLRERAVFVVSQTETREAAQLLMDVVRDDPSDDVREQAVFWLGQVPGEESLEILMKIARSDPDEELQAKAVFALSQHEDSRAAEVLREIALDRDRREEVRGQAIFWLGQHGRGDDVEFLLDLYDSLESRDLKGHVLNAASQHEGSKVRAWLRQLALDEDEDREVRGYAIYWLGQNEGLDLSEMRDLYESLADPELRGQVLFAASQSDENEVVDFLLEVAKNETDPELRRHAVFWLGQVDDPRVAEFLIELLEQ